MPLAYDGGIPLLHSGRGGSIPSGGTKKFYKRFGKLKYYLYLCNVMPRWWNGRHEGLRKKFFEINVTTDFFSSV